MSTAPIEIIWLRQPKIQANYTANMVARHLNGYNAKAGLTVFDDARIEDQIFTIAAYLAQVPRKGRQPRPEHLESAWARIDRAAGHRVRRIEVNLDRPVRFKYPYDLT